METRILILPPNENSYLLKYVRSMIFFSQIS